MTIPRYGFSYLENYARDRVTPMAGTSYTRWSTITLRHALRNTHKAVADYWRYISQASRPVVSL